ncbi:BQ5605_C017g08420 [Microbotryum silenes-dioicae]|uniref:BQ5605_C017g08420 protein n=1 Tax=Microbotryum silenes-dioicae TaxID=796604 RepID=A0A2X0LUW2_9BASI|nr:BQ5605_C017g08420 [Microbotryum silenes-dioicae]
MDSVTRFAFHSAAPCSMATQLTAAMTPSRASPSPYFPRPKRIRPYSVASPEL